MTPADYRALQASRRWDPVDQALAFAGGFLTGAALATTVCLLVAALLGFRA